VPGAWERGDHAAYVGLPPGTITSAVRVDISSRRSLALSFLAEGAIANGGFDPIPIVAEVGDTLTVVITRDDGSKSTFSPVVPTPGPPVVLRLSPTTGTREVPLNAALFAVFSEPILPSSQPAGAMGLLQSGIEVAGVLRPRDDQSLVVALDPAVILESGATYQLVVTKNVVTAAGQHLATPVQGSFTTTAAALPSALAIESFTMIEYQYPSAPGWWSYAPQIRVDETSGHGSITIFRIDITIPGFGPSPGVCSTGIRVAAGSGRDLVSERYGDYELSYDAGGKRAEPGEATVVLTYSDETGRKGTLSAHGPIVSGALPTTYTGGQSTMAPLDCRWQ
jgi:hypothetical protein